MSDTSYFNGIDVISNGSTILSVDAKDAEARSDLADLEDYVQGISPVSLSATQNGTYTAPTGVFGYSPVVVDTGIYVGTSNPSSDLGKNGDYYYKRYNYEYGCTYKNMTNSMHTTIGYKFYPNEDVAISKLRLYTSQNTVFTLYISDGTNIIYESEQITADETGWNEHTLSTPVSLTANSNYFIYTQMNSTNGKYCSISNTTVSSMIHLVNGVHSYPLETDTYDTYLVDAEFVSDTYRVQSEYTKRNGSWVQL